jgi:hypothetical protein
MPRGRGPLAGLKDPPGSTGGAPAVGAKACSAGGRAGEQAGGRRGAVRRGLWVAGAAGGRCTGG